MLAHPWPTGSATFSLTYFELVFHSSSCFPVGTGQISLGVGSSFCSVQVNHIQNIPALLTLWVVWQPLLVSCYSSYFEENLLIFLQSLSEIGLSAIWDISTFIYSPHAKFTILIIIDYLFNSILSFDRSFATF